MLINLFLGFLVYHPAFAEASCTQSSSKTNDCGVFGARTVLAIRVIAPDSRTTSSMNEISNTIFGSYGKEFTMKSQFSECSYDQFNTVEFQGQTITGFDIANGVAEVEISRNVIGTYLSIVEEEVLLAANEKIGDLKSQFDFVMLFIPKGSILAGTSGWKAYAFLNHWMSVYNDDWSKYPSIHLHEIGHNVGLTHSHTSRLSYGDSTCYMGASATEVDGPLICFSAAFSWALGWYNDSVGAFDVETIGDGVNEWINIKLIGFSGYGSYKKSEKKEDDTDTYHLYTIVKLTNTADGFDYYLHFNSKSGITSGSGEDANTVLISKKHRGSEYEDSYLIGKLKKDWDIFHLEGVRNDGEGINVWFWENDKKETLPNALIDLSRLWCTDDSACEKNDSCSEGKCDYVIHRCVFTEKECSSCGSNVTMEITTNTHANRTSWAIENLDTKKIVMSNNNMAFNRYYIETKCLEYATYRFLVECHGDDALAIVTYKIQSNNHIIFEGSTNSLFVVDDSFTVCSAVEDCKDFNGCTIGVCNQTTSLCKNKVKANDDCYNCSWVSLKITPDIYPEETTWDLVEDESKDIIMSGDPHLNFGRGKESGGEKKNGRKKKSGRKKKNGRTSQRSLDEVLDDGNISETICLENDHKYHFSIHDSFGDGLCCVEGNGTYILSINSAVMRQGGNFGDLDYLQFKSKNCTSDVDCDDDDVTTTDTCNINASACMYFLRACGEYGERVKITILTNLIPSKSTWVIIDENGVVQTAGGPYNKAYTNYSHPETCFVDGLYTFEYTGKQLMTIVIQLGDEVLLDFDANVIWLNDREETFEVKSTSTVTRAPTQSMMPTESLPLVKLLLPGRLCSKWYNLGFHNSAEECATAALDDSRCNNNFIAWSYQYPHLQICGCCTQTTCPLDSAQFYTNSTYDVYEFRSCPTPHPTTPTAKLSLNPSPLPSYSPSNIPTDISTKNYSKCAKESKRAKQCGAKGGRNACCPGLVCHHHQYWRCVQKKHKSCSGPFTFSKSCGSKYENAAPTCCPGLTCVGKKCIAKEQTTCAEENERSRYCGADYGEDICCNGLVCHVYQSWRCVQEKNKECAGPGTYAKQCGSYYKKAAPECCAGLTCHDKKCVVS